MLGFTIAITAKRYNQKPRRTAKYIAVVVAPTSATSILAA